MQLAQNKQNNHYITQRYIIDKQITSQNKQEKKKTINQLNKRRRKRHRNTAHI